MRSLPLLSLLLVCAGCNARLAGPRGLTVSAGATIRAEARVEPAVALEGAAVVEFFGVPLEGAEDVVFVLDRSGSMSDPAQGRIAQIGIPNAASPAPRKIDVAHEELVDALERLPEGTRMNVVFFNDRLEAFAPGIVPLEASSRDGLVAFVRDTGPAGSTALARAMRIAFLMNARRVVLLSDGLRDAREAMRGGVRIDTIGLGGNQDAELMQALATESGGLYQAL
jgi:hypothetical protein